MAENSSGGGSGGLYFSGAFLYSGEDFGFHSGKTLTQQTTTSAPAPAANMTTTTTTTTEKTTKP